MKRAHQYIVFLLIGVSIALVGALILPDPLHLRWSRWAYSDWLISYDAGFVRRGLAGGLIRLVQGGIGDLVVVNLLVFANYTVLCLLLLWVWLKSTARSPLAFVLAILIPGGLFQMAAGNEYFFRKEILFHVGLGIDCVLYGLVLSADTVARRLRFAWLFFGVFLTQGVIFPLVHESYLFMSFPAAWLLARHIAATLPGQRGFGHLVKLSVVVQGLMFAACAVFKGNPDAVGRMWQMLSPSDRLLISPTAPTLPDGGLMALGWSTFSSLGFIARLLASGQFWIWGFAGVGIAAILMLVALWSGRIATGCDRDKLRWHGARLGFLFVASTPMYLLGVDWGRWLSAVTVSWLFVLFADGSASLATPDMLRFVPPRLRPRARAIVDFISDDVLGAIVTSSSRHRKAVFLMALFFCLTFRSPECCLAMGFNPFYRIKPVLEQMFR